MRIDLLHLLITLQALEKVISKSGKLVLGRNRTILDERPHLAGASDTIVAWHALLHGREVLLELLSALNSRITQLADLVAIVLSPLLTVEASIKVNYEER